MDIDLAVSRIQYLRTAAEEEKDGMGTLLKAALLLAAVAGAPVGYVFYQAALSPNDWVYQGGRPSNWSNGGVHGAPGPIAGAGLPVVAIGFGGFWLYRRYRRKPD